MKRKKVGFPRLSRRGKLIRNLLIVFFLAAASWVLAGCPAWTEAGALGRLERTLLLEPGTLRVRQREDGDIQVLVTGEDYAYTAYLYPQELFWRKAALNTWTKLGEEMVLFPWVMGDFQESLEQGTWLCPNPLEGAQRWELTVSLDYELDGGLVRQGKRQVQDYETGSAVVHAQGTLEKSGLLRLETAAGSGREAVVLRALLAGTGYEMAEDGRWRRCTVTSADYQMECFDGNGNSMGLWPVVLPSM